VFAAGAAGGDPNQQLDRVVTPFLLDDGRVAVPTRGSFSISIFSPEGDYLTRLGGEGEGPGEFRSLLAAWPRGDTIEALDNRLRRITRFLPAGDVEVIELRAELSDLSGAAGPVTDGWIVSGVAGAGPDGRDEIGFRRISRDGMDRGEVARVPGYARYVVEGVGSGPGPLSPRSVRTVATGRVYAGDSLIPRITVYSSDGAIEREIAWRPASTRTAADVLGEVVDSAIARAPEARSEYTRRFLAAAPVPEELSVFWGVLVDDEGFVWVRPFEPLRHAAALGGLCQPSGGAGGSWRVFAPDGAEVATIEMPDDLEPLRITTDALIGVARDSLGVETVRIHALNRTR
jgi:hypothetical protein